MSAFARIRRGWHLGYHSLRIVLRDKTLLLFPLIPFTTAIMIIVSFCVVVGADQLFWALFVVNTLQHARYLALGYAIVAVVSVYFSVGLVACARISIEGQDSKFMDGILAAMRKFHWVVLWGLISWTIGPLLNLLDHLRYTSRWVRKITKTSWSQLSYFLLPILIVDNVNIFSAIRRSVTVTIKTWGEGSVSQLGFLWFFFFMNIPTMLLFGYGHYMEGPWPKPLTFVVLSMIYFTIVVYQTASSVLSVVLYKYATDGTVVEGFNGEWLKEAFVRQKVYVLVDADKDPGQPVEDVPAPDGVEPATATPDVPEAEEQTAPDNAADDVAPEEGTPPSESEAVEEAIPAAAPENDEETDDRPPVTP